MTSKDVKRPEKTSIMWHRQSWGRPDLVKMDALSGHSYKSTLKCWNWSWIIPNNSGCLSTGKDICRPHFHYVVLKEFVRVRENKKCFGRPKDKSKNVKIFLVFFVSALNNATLKCFVFCLIFRFPVWDGKSAVMAKTWQRTLQSWRYNAVKW